MTKIFRLPSIGTAVQLRADEQQRSAPPLRPASPAQSCNFPVPQREFPVRANNFPCSDRPGNVPASG